MNTKFQVIDASAPKSHQKEFKEIGPQKVTPIPLFRKLGQDVDVDPDRNTDGLASSLGLAVGLLLSVSFWALISLGVWFAV